MKRILFALLFCLICGGIAFAASPSLSGFPKTARPAVLGKRIAEKFVRSGHSQYGNTRSGVVPTQITYPDVCTWLGGLWFAQTTGDTALTADLIAKFDLLFDSEKALCPKPNHVDNNVFGAVPLEIYLQTQQQRYLDLGLFYADTQWQLPPNANETERKWASEGYTWQTRIWIDDMFMITAVQSQASRATDRVEYLDRAAREMLMYLSKIQLPNGLFYHSPEAHFCWARGNGWMAAGLTELLRALPINHQARTPLMEAYHKMMATLLHYQTPGGMWRQIIDDPEAWEESSGTAMFTYAFITGVKEGWLPKKAYGKAARKGWLALVNHLNADDELTDVCEGTNIKNSRDHYMNRKRITGDLHGQAPLLWCATALLRK